MVTTLLMCARFSAVDTVNDDIICKRGGRDSASFKLIIKFAVNRTKRIDEMGEPCGERPFVTDFALASNICRSVCEKMLEPVDQIMWHAHTVYFFHKD